MALGQCTSPSFNARTSANWGFQTLTSLQLNVFKILHLFQWGHTVMGIGEMKIYELNFDILRGGFTDSWAFWKRFRGCRNESWPTAEKAPPCPVPRWRPSGKPFAHHSHSGHFSRDIKFHFLCTSLLLMRVGRFVKVRKLRDLPNHSKQKSRPKPNLLDGTFGLVWFCAIKKKMG